MIGKPIMLRLIFLWADLTLTPDESDYFKEKP